MNMSPASPPARGARLSVPRAAAYLGISRGALYRLASDRRIPHYRLVNPKGDRIWFFAGELDAWLEAHRVPARAKDEPRLHVPTEPIPMGIADLLPAMSKRAFL